MLDINLSYFEFPPGATYKFGETFVTMVSGWHKPPPEWGIASTSGEYRNAGSIVIRVQYKGKSILLCGDTIGRHIGDGEDVCIAAEEFMVNNSPVITIDSDIIVAPHHGADNGSSKNFIDAVDPTYVIFSAGHKHDHPRSVAAQRYIDAGVDVNNMFRTDLKDDEAQKEWSHGRQNGHSDPIGDDDVDILVKVNGTIHVAYRN